MLEGGEALGPAAPAPADFPVFEAVTRRALSGLIWGVFTRHWLEHRHQPSLTVPEEAQPRPWLRFSHEVAVRLAFGVELGL